VDAHYIFHPSTIWVRPLCTELGPKNPHFAKKQTNICRLSGDITRMVQLPATAAIEYVAAGHFFPGGLLAGGLMPVPPKFNAYTNRLGFLCLA